jgi:DNA-binding PadR family transcriptional regulator
MVVLALACEEPMHPYRMQTLIKQRGKDQIANVAQRNSVYQTIAALLRAGLIAVRETSRPDRHPERTVYEATPAGRQALRSWVRGGLSTVAREYPEFPAALSTMLGAVDGPDDLRALLEMRVAALQPRLAEMEKPWPHLPRVFLLEAEYAAAVTRAEIQWLRSVIADLRAGRLTFPTLEQMLQIGAAMGGPSEDAILRVAAEMKGTPKRSIASRKRRAKAPRSDALRRRASRGK